MKLNKAKQKQLDTAYDTLIQVCLYDRPLKEMEPFLAGDVMNFGAGKKEITKTKTAFLKQIKNQKKLAAGLEMDFKIKPVLRKITSKGDGAIYTDDIVNTVWVNGVKNELKFRLSFIFEYKQHKWIMVHSHTSAPDSQRTDDEIWPVEELKKRTEALEKSLDEKIAELEIKNRELEIEAALEKVRSRSLAMHKSEELEDVVRSVSERMKELDVEVYAAIIIIFSKDSKDTVWWVANKLNQEYSCMHVKYADYPFFVGLFQAKEIGKELFSARFSFSEKNELYNYLFEHTDFRHTPGEQKQFLLDAKTISFSAALAKDIGILITNYTEKTFSEKDNEILKRFANTFDQAYTRFNDLQKAEAQAREAQIETSLERVRSKAMAMQKSEDLAIAVSIIFEELEKLNHKIIRCGIAIHNKIKNTADLWTTTITDKGRIAQVTGDEPMDIHPMLQGAYESWLKQTDYTYTLQGDDLINFYKALTATNFTLPGSQSVDMKTEGLQQHLYVAHFPAGGLYAFSQTSFPDETKTVIRRFADVFNLTYTRFNDLQKAEAQAREATIEASLEKVRGKSMAMHTSDDLSATASMVFTELRKLGINPIRCGVGLLNKESRKAQLYSATSSAGGDSLSLVGWVMLSKNPVAEKIYESWLKNEDYYPELSGEQLRLYYENLLSGLSLPDVPDWQNGQKQYGHFLPFSIGCLFAWSEIPYNDTEIKILKRFATIIDLTFRRYMDLQKSEASAKVAVRQASLDRVRAEIASMRTTNDLEKITPLIWNELTVLGIPFIRCGVFIMDDLQRLIHTFLSTPDGKALAAFHLPYDTPGNFTEMVSRWHHKQTYIAHWGEAEFISIADVLLKQGAIATKEQYLHTLPAGGFYLHFLPFLQGMLYVGNIAQLGNDEILLIQSVADAFSTAYARYEDFNKLEAAKQIVEKTLADLKQAQTQLVQSEKMASLGELTAGIAHEIQNPLNFVNNFSEVNKELVDELQSELKAGNTEGAIAISDDIKVNEEKINHHGKRADSIVKGMLQHSRSSSGVKEPTNINTLADEYLRLSYHGLRAKDKSFNATMKTDFTETIGNINIIPQDIGRVLLNLYNNAFYAVNEKKQRAGNSYEPTIEVSTSRSLSHGEGRGEVRISVKDNGNGISQKVVDKIFQPFFTTKPTGQGTGLGLSLSYDIIKAHGGEIKVETKEGEGTEFIVQLPLV
jgi:signal transduction histidine kinase